MLVLDVWYVFKLGEHKGVSFGDDPDDCISLVGLFITLREFGDPRVVLLGEVEPIVFGITATRFLPLGVVDIIMDGSFFGLNVSPVLRSFASSSSRSNLSFLGLFAAQFSRATLTDLWFKKWNRKNHYNTCFELKYYQQYYMKQLSL